jgi:non-homologous end joining protein Ku
MNKVPIGRVVLTNREHIIALEPLDKGLIGTLLRYPYEVRSEEEYFDEIQEVSRRIRRWNRSAGTSWYDHRLEI